METIDELMSHFPRAGKVAWIGVRPQRRQDVVSVEEAEVTRGGIVGDHRDKEGMRAITLIQFEHLATIAVLAGLDHVDPALLRRNVAVSGINLLALKDKTFRLGSALLKGTEICAPCSRMEELLGAGGYNAMRGHGGLCATVLEAGEIRIGSPVEAIPAE